MNLPEARETGQRITALVQAEKPGEAYMLLAPILAGRTPFRLLDCIGQAIGAGPLPAVNAFLERIAADKTEGGWVVIASALTQQLDRDFAGAFSRCRDFVIAADIWYATDSLGERLPGPALRMDFQAALGLLSGWQTDPNPWVRRIIGVAVHFWAKRSGGKPQYRSQAESLLALLQPMFEERNLNALKGVGWGLKTLGKHYPDLVAAWLEVQLVQCKRRPRSLMLRKALTYLPQQDSKNDV